MVGIQNREVIMEGFLRSRVKKAVLHPKGCRIFGE